MITKGIAFKKGDLVRYDNQVYEVEEDNDWWDNFDSWGSVKLVGLYPPIFTHKGGITLYDVTPGKIKLP